MDKIKESISELIRRKVFEYFSGVGDEGQLPSDATITRFSRRVGINRGTVSRIVNGHNTPSYETLRRMVGAPEVGSEALAALGIIPDDPRIVELLDAVIQGRITSEQLGAAIERARQFAPGSERAYAEANPD
jgi:transcriptional regulator with XRE-family HTH domain